MKRNMFRSTVALFMTVFVLSALITGCSGSGDKPDSNFNGVQIGVITYSWRSMPGTAEDILNYCIQNGISSIELMGNVAEEYAGAPPMPPWPGRGAEMTEEERDSVRNVFQVASEKQSEWRLTASMDKYKELRKMFNDAGVNIHIVKFSPAKWLDEEVDYAFKAAKIMGAKGVSNEIGHEACERLGKFAEKHDMYAIFHNHGQPGDPEFNFEEFLAYSPNNMLNLDVGHYFGATGQHPNEIIEKLHNRIFSLHLKDKTGKDADPADTNTQWGEGDTPLADILKLIQDNKWDIYCDIELEYKIPEDSDAVQETAKCVEYCKNILL
ncbi:MAG: sugar phosphate isomerase/epimerase [Bacteroidales bacterium]|nr:sugar phosphate isomerase/epimerase [Bacteroidales bacterium]